MRISILKIMNWIIILAGSALIISCNNQGSQRKPIHPNVILIMTDDQGYGEFSCIW